METQKCWFGLFLVCFALAGCSTDPKLDGVAAPPATDEANNDTGEQATDSGLRSLDAGLVSPRSEDARTADATGILADAGTVGVGATADGAVASEDCDRACLLRMMQAYLDALIAHDPSTLPLAAALKMTNNGESATPSDDLWKTATKLVADARLDFADPVTHNVGTQCVVNKGDTPVLYQVRLKVEHQQITEIESVTLTESNAWFFFEPAGLKPEPVFLKAPDPQKRMSRDELSRLTQLYLDYLEGKASGSDVPWDDQCARYENGVVTASGVASFQLQSWGFEVTRRVLIIDEEAGIAWGMFPFMQSDTALVVGEAFKLLDGKIMMIQAVMGFMPAKAWD